jgi:ankyrin repeat protein
MAGADRQARLIDGRTLLHLAAQYNENPAMIDALLAAGARPMGRDRTGSTPLHKVASNDVPAMIVQALVAAGAQLNARDEEGNTPLHLAAFYHEDDRHGGAAIEALLNAGADATVPNAAGQTPWDLAEENDVLRGSDGYWLLNDARFNVPAPDVRNPTSTTPNRRQAEVAPVSPPERQGPGCEIPDYPTPADIQNLGVSWCGPSVNFQMRAHALQAAGAWCAIDGGSSSTPEQIDARHQEINLACDTLDALEAQQGGRTCQCPEGYRP